MSGRLSAYQRDGFVLLPALLSADDVCRFSAILNAAARDDPEDNPLSLGSMRFASNVYRSRPELLEILISEPLVDVLTELVGPDTWLRWDQAVWKHPGAPAFPMHQDNGYTGLDVEHLQVWFALTPSHQANGGLCVVPGGHLDRLDHEWVGHHLAATAHGPEVAIAAEIGDVVAFSSWLPHSTPPNATGDTRLAYVAEFLPLGADDPGVELPHLVTTERGRPAGRWRSHR